MSDTVTTSDQRSCIKIETLRGKNPTEIHCVLSEVYGDIHSGLPVSRWANGFRGICVSIENDPRSGRPRISTDKRSVMLMADSLGKDRRATCEEIPRAT